jgi:hypothetical protein
VAPRPSSGCPSTLSPRPSSSRAPSPQPNSSWAPLTWQRSSRAPLPRPRSGRHCHLSLDPAGHCCLGPDPTGHHHLGLMVFPGPTQQAAWSRPRSGPGACLGPDLAQACVSAKIRPRSIILAQLRPGSIVSARISCSGPDPVRPVSSPRLLPHPLASTLSMSLQPPPASLRPPWLRPSLPFRLPPLPLMSALWVLS